MGRNRSGAEGGGETSLVAQVHATHSDFAVESAGRRAPDVRLSVVEFVGRSDGTAAAFVEAWGGDLSEFEAALAAEPGVGDWEAIGGGASQRLYSVRLAGLEPRLRRACVEVGVHVSQMRLHAEGWLLNLQLPDREALTELAARWHDDGIDFQLKRLTETESGYRDGRCAGLTAEQYELLRTAHASGYFEIPREASQVDLAEELGVSTSGVSQHVRRALAALLASVMEGERERERSAQTDPSRLAGR